MMKLCFKCGIEKMITNFFILEKPIKNIDVNVYSVVVINRKNGEIKTKKKLKIIKNNIIKIIENKYAINRKNFMMRIVM